VKQRSVRRRSAAAAAAYSGALGLALLLCGLCACGPKGGARGEPPAPLRIRIDPAQAAAWGKAPSDLPQSGDAAAAAGRPVWTQTLAGHEEFLRYSSPVQGSPFTKFVINPQDDQVYFFWTAIYPFHYHFVTEVLQRRYADMDDFNRTHHAGWDKSLVLGSIGYQNGVHAFEFLESESPDEARLRYTLDRLSRAFTGVRLFYRAVSSAQEEVARRTEGLPWVTAEFVGSDATFQCLNEGSAVGRLVVLPPGGDAASLAPLDIVALHELPMDISPVAGVLALRFSTPLSHVNLRARAWGIPNAGHKGMRAAVQALAGQIVAYRVQPEGLELRAATEAERQAYEERRARASGPQRLQIPAADLARRDLPELVGLRAQDVTWVGAKAANLGELATRGGGATFQVPAGLVLPFAYYVDHLRGNGLQGRIQAILDDSALRGDPRRLGAALAELRQAIRSAPLDASLAERLLLRVHHLLPEAGLFVRSSTNAEDLPGFNGAGLYDTVPNVRGDEAILDAVRQVWASIWNLRAFRERDHQGIDHRSVYPGVILQQGVDADAAGVLVTRDIFRRERGRALYINAKRGLGLRVVDGRRVPEQVLVNEASHDLRIISRSDDAVALQFDAKGGVREVAVARGEPVLSEARVWALVAAADEVREIFPQIADSLDIEWLTVGEQVFLVQARPYVEAAR